MAPKLRDKLYASVGDDVIGYAVKAVNAADKCFGKFFGTKSYYGDEVTHFCQTTYYNHNVLEFLVIVLADR